MCYTGRANSLTKDACFPWSLAQEPEDYWHARQKEMESLCYLQNIWVQALPSLKELGIETEWSCLSWMEELFNTQKVILPKLKIFPEAKSDFTIPPTVHERPSVHPGRPVARHLRDADKFSPPVSSLLASHIHSTRFWLWARKSL